MRIKLGMVHNQNAHTTTLAINMLAQDAKLLVRTRASTPTVCVAPSKANGGTSVAAPWLLAWMGILVARFAFVLGTGSSKSFGRLYVR